ncbi:MAG: SiaB family protein kinase [Flavobacteriia bacterium]|jgi:hypothetical protein
MIEDIQNKVSEEIRFNFKRYLDLFANEDPRSVVVSHLGAFSQDLVNSIAANVEELMVTSGDAKIAVKRVFGILIEGLQNIRIHGAKDEHGRQMAYLILARNQEDYKIVFGNLVAAKDVSNLSEYLDAINEMDGLELKEKYIEILSSGYLSQRNGSGVGFLTMRMKSGNTLYYTIDAISDDINFLTVEVTLARS